MCCPSSRIALSSSTKLVDRLDTTIIRSDIQTTTSCARPCCRVPNLHRLRVIVIYAQPWTALPGAPKNPDAHDVNQAPANTQVPLTAGLPWCIQLAAMPTTLGTPVNRRYDPGAVVVRPGWNAKYNVPQDVYAKYGTSLEHAKSFAFDFGVTCTREAHGQLLAYGRHGAVQASIDFTYRFPKPAHKRSSRRRHDASRDAAACDARPTPLLTRFEITGCTTKNAKFLTLGDVNDFLPTCDDDECFDAVVVLGIQQWCCKCGPDQIPDASGDYAPHFCESRPLNCAARRSFASC